MSDIRIRHGSASVELESMGDVRSGDGRLVVAYYRADDLLEATRRALSAIGDDRANTLAAMLGPTS